MKELAVISGKGGTGKTSVVASLAALADCVVVADCDVDAPDLHLVLSPEIVRREAFFGGKRAQIDSEMCNACGTCAQVCRYEAVSRVGPPDARGEATFYIDPIACEGCGVCAWFCPETAITLDPVTSGEIYLSTTRLGPMVHARLRAGHGNSGKLVSAVRDRARRYAERHGYERIITDGSPGIGCPVIASITGADVVLIVTEPTRSAVHDFERVASLVAGFRIPAMVCINKWDLNAELSLRIEHEARHLGVVVAGKVPYDDTFTEAQVQCKAIVELGDGESARAIRNVWNMIEETMAPREFAKS